MQRFAKTITYTDASTKLRALNTALLSLQASRQPIKGIMLDFDDTVVTVFGNQETANIGYNPKYHGRQLFKAKMTQNVQKLVKYVTEHPDEYLWMPTTEDGQVFHTTDITVPPLLGTKPEDLSLSAKPSQQRWKDSWSLTSADMNIRLSSLT